MATLASILERRSTASDRTRHPGGASDSTGVAGTGSIIQSGDFRIDVDSRSATVRGHKLDLSCAEFDALVYLASHRRRLVTAHTSLATKSEDSGVRHTELLRALLSLQKKLREVVPGTQYLQTEAWILYDFHPGT